MQQKNSQVKFKINSLTNKQKYIEMAAGENHSRCHISTFSTKVTSLHSLRPPSTGKTMPVTKLA